MTATPTFHDTARATVVAQMLDWAKETFPGVTDLTDAPGNHTEILTDLQATGRWHGQLLAFFVDADNDFSATVLADCPCCGEQRTYYGTFRNVLAMVQVVPDAFPATVPQCWYCESLHFLQPQARKVRTALGRAWFRSLHGKTTAEVLAQHEARA